MNKLLVWLAAIAALSLAAAACGGASSTASQPTTPSPAATEGWRTPAQLPVTPVALSFHTTDPKLDALPGARTIVGENAGAT